MVGDDLRRNAPAQPWTMGNDFDWFVLTYTADWRERLERLRLILVRDGAVPAEAFRNVNERLAGHALVALRLARWDVPAVDDPVPLSVLEAADTAALRAIDFRTAPVSHLRQRL